MTEEALVDPWEARRQRELDQQQEQEEADREFTRQVAEALGARTGEDWMITFSQNGDGRASLLGPEDMKIRAWMNPWNKKGFVQWKIDWPRYETEPGMTCDLRTCDIVSGVRKYDWPDSINVNRSRPAAEHAREIASRLLPNLRDIWPAVRLRILQVDNENKARWQHIRDMATRVGGTVFEKGRRGYDKEGCPRPDSIERSSFYSPDGQGPPSLIMHADKYWPERRLILELDRIPREKQLELMSLLRNLLWPDG